jgi:hypothetical protein
MDQASTTIIRTAPRITDPLGMPPIQSAILGFVHNGVAHASFVFPFGKKGS